jgi:hypothetical protein
MATKKATKKVAKFLDTLYVTRDEWVDGEFYNASTIIDECASDKTVRVGVYQLVGVKSVTKKVEIVTEDVNG